MSGARALALAGASLAWFTGCAGDPASTSTSSNTSSNTASTEAAEETQRERLFDGTSLARWKPTEFGGAGELLLEDGALHFELGNPLTGITWNGGALPREDYALEVRATKLAGHDFFCGLTFPIGEECASLILGGWGGTTCGLSCIDGRDASENETTSYRRFEPEREHKIRVEVSTSEVRAFLDGERLFAVARAGKRFAVRGEVVASQPLGLCAFATRTAVHEIALVPLSTAAGPAPR
ncbi:MAG: DUF1080 domain-containing protein [Planctomycetes bacterium]|nr:DUF1080 domain-containing protein [Planctomycetota bacterium]